MKFIQFIFTLIAILLAGTATAREFYEPSQSGNMYLGLGMAI